MYMCIYMDIYICMYMCMYIYIYIDMSSRASTAARSLSTPSACHPPLRVIGVPRS